MQNVTNVQISDYLKWLGWQIGRSKKLLFGYLMAKLFVKLLLSWEHKELEYVDKFYGDWKRKTKHTTM